MIIRGKEYNFLYTIRASLEIAKNLDGHQMASIGKVFQTGDQIKSMDLIITMAVAMNRAYLKAKAFDDGTEFDESQVITRDIIENLTMQQESELEDAVIKAMTAGNKTEVETQPEKKSKKNPGNESN